MLSTAEKTEIRIKCPSCGKGSRHYLAWLMTQKTLRCPTPDCGTVIDLTSGESMDVIAEAAKVAAKADKELKSED